MLSLLYLRVQAQQYFVSLSYMVVDKKTVLKIWLDLGLNLTFFRGTGPRAPRVILLPVSQRFVHPRVLGIPIPKSLPFWHRLLILLQRFGHPPVPSRDTQIPSVLVKIPSKKILDFAGKSKTF